MRRAWEAFWICVWSTVFGITVFRNFKKYKDQPFMWKLGKSALDFLALGLMALFLPPLMVAMNSNWISGFFEQKWKKVVVGILSGILFGFVSTFAMESMVIVGIFSIDTKTGPDGGLLKRWRQMRSGLPFTNAAAA